MDYEDYKERIFDVRKESEYISSHIVGAHNLPLSSINQQLSSIPPSESVYIHCAGGYRSMIASSILKSRGYHDLIDVQGGFKSIKDTDIPISEYVCPTTL